MWKKQPKSPISSSSHFSTSVHTHLIGGSEVYPPIMGTFGPVGDDFPWFP